MTHIWEKVIIFLGENLSKVGNRKIAIMAMKMVVLIPKSNQPGSVPKRHLDLVRIDEDNVHLGLECLWRELVGDDSLMQPLCLALPLCVECVACRDTCSFVEHRCLIRDFFPLLELDWPSNFETKPDFPTGQSRTKPDFPPLSYLPVLALFTPIVSPNFFFFLLYLHT